MNKGIVNATSGCMTMATPRSQPHFDHPFWSMATIAYMANVMARASSAWPQIAATGQAMIPMRMQREIRRPAGTSNCSARASEANTTDRGQQQFDWLHDERRSRM